MYLRPVIHYRTILIVSSFLFNFKVTTGPLGQGIANAVGLAMAAKVKISSSNFVVRAFSLSMQQQPSTSPDSPLLITRSSSFAETGVYKKVSPLKQVRLRDITS